MSDFASPNVKCSSFSCSQCGIEFTSRNKLFHHLRQCATMQKLRSLADMNHETQCQFNKVGILVLGGRLRGRTLASVECYDVAAAAWLNVSLPPMLENRGSHAAASIGDEVYVVGGGGFDSNLSACEKYRCSSGEGWTGVAPLCMPRHALGAAVANSKLYAVGGWINGSVCSGDMEVYDAATEQWVQLASMLLPRRLHGVAAYNNTHIYVFGGSCNDPYWHTAEVERYCISSNTWAACSAVPEAGGNAAATVITPQTQLIFVFVFGKRVYCYDPEKDIYIARSKLPVHDWHCFQVVAVGVHIYVIGGASAGKWSKVAYKYDTTSDIWTQLPDMHTPRRRCAIAAVPVENLIFNNPRTVDVLNTSS